MPKHELRKNERQAFTGLIEVSWTDASGQPMFVRGKCVELSDSGLRMELPVPLPAHITVTLRIASLQLSGPASIRHVRRVGAKYTAGVEMSQRLRDAVSAKCLTTQGFINA